MLRIPTRPALKIRKLLSVRFFDRQKLDDPATAPNGEDYPSRASPCGVIWTRAPLKRSIENPLKSSV